MSDKAPELIRAEQVAVRMDSLERNLQKEPELWEHYVSDCMYAYAEQVRERGGATEDMKKAFEAVAERAGYLTKLVIDGGEISLADRISVAEVLVDLSQQGISLAEYSVRKENN